MSGRMRNAPGMGLALALAFATAGLLPTVAVANPFSSWKDFTDWGHSTLDKAHLGSWSDFTNWEHQTATKAHLNSWSNLSHALGVSHGATKASAARPHRTPALAVPKAGSHATSTSAKTAAVQTEPQFLLPPAAVGSSGNPGGASTSTSTTSGPGQLEAQTMAVPEPSAFWVLAAGAFALARGWRGRGAGGRSRR